MCTEFVCHGNHNCSIGNDVLKFLLFGILKENSFWNVGSKLSEEFQNESHLKYFSNKAFVLSQGEFDLETNFNPNILVTKVLDYDQTKKVTMTLYVQVSFDSG